MKVLGEELDRNFTYLQENGDPKPYFMSYEVTDSQTDTISASQGSIDSQNHSHRRILDTTVRVGSYKFDNYHLEGGRQPRFNRGMAMTIEDNPLAIRHALWLATDQVYRAASQRLIQLEGNEQLRSEGGDSSDDFSKEQAQVYSADPPQIHLDADGWAERLRKLSADFTKYPGALNSSVQMEVKTVIQTLVTSEGTRIHHGRPYVRLVIYAVGKTADGMDLQTVETFESDDPAKLPSDQEILAAVETAGKNLTGLLNAPLAAPYVGPAVLSGRAAGVLFHEIFGHRIEGHRQKDDSEGQTFTKAVNQAILPQFLSVIFDPTRKTYDGVSLNGYYEYDDEGVKARKVDIVEDGILRTFLMSRSPVDGFPNSNGHGRRAPGNEIVSRQSNLIVESTNQHTDAELREMLIEQVKSQGKPYGLYFDQVTGGYTTTGRQGLQAFTVIPLVVYRVYPDGRPDELIRGVDIVGTPLASFAKIIATGDMPQIFNGICGAESGNVPVSAISPSLLISEIEVQNKERSQDRPPYLDRPNGSAVGLLQ